MKTFKFSRMITGTVVLCGTAALLLSVAPEPLTDMLNGPAYAAGQGGGQGQGGGGGGGGSDGGGGGGGQGGGGQGAGGQGSGGQIVGGQGGSPGSGSDEPHDDGGDDDSDRPDWAGVPGGRDGAGGGQPDNAGSTKGDLFGDLFVIARDENGVPILTPEGWVQPLDEFGNLIPLDEEGHPVDESLTVEVEIGRLNVGRAPSQVLDRRLDEVITLMDTATAVATDAAGRLVFTVDGELKTIDSPLENLAIYTALMTTGTIPGVTDLPGTAFDYMVDGQLTAADLEGSAVFLAAATDKTGVFTTDEIAYIDAFLGIQTETIGSVTYSDIDYSTFDYDRQDAYGEVTVEVLVQQTDGSWVPTVVSIYDEVFGGVPAAESGTLEAYTMAAEDARMVVNFIHEYEVPVTDLEASSH